MKEAACNISPEDILESLVGAVFTVDSAWRITSFNRGAEKITGRSRQDVLGKRCNEVFRSNLCLTDCPLRKAMAGDISTLVGRAFIVDSEGLQVPVNVSAAVLRNCKGKVVGGVETFHDLRLQSEEKCNMERAVKGFETQAIIAALRRNNNNRTAAAHDLGIHKSTFFRKIKSLGIALPQFDGRFRSNDQG